MVCIPALRVKVNEDAVSVELVAPVRADASTLCAVYNQLSALLAGLVIQAFDGVCILIVTDALAGEAQWMDNVKGGAKGKRWVAEGWLRVGSMKYSGDVVWSYRQPAAMGPPAPEPRGRAISIVRCGVGLLRPTRRVLDEVLTTYEIVGASVDGAKLKLPMMVRCL